MYLLEKIHYTYQHVLYNRKSTTCKELTKITVLIISLLQKTYLQCLKTLRIPRLSQL